MVSGAKSLITLLYLGHGMIFTAVQNSQYKRQVCSVTKGGLHRLNTGRTARMLTSS